MPYRPALYPNYLGTFLELFKYLPYSIFSMFHTYTVRRIPNKGKKKERFFSPKPAKALTFNDLRKPGRAKSLTVKHLRLKAKIIKKKFAIRQKNLYCILWKLRLEFQWVARHGASQFLTREKTKSCPARLNISKKYRNDWNKKRNSVHLFSAS